MSPLRHARSTIRIRSGPFGDLHTHVCSLVLLCILGAPPVAAQPRPASLPHASLAGQLDLARLVDLASQRLNLNIEYDPASLKGAVTLRLATGLSDDELWLLVNRSLAARGFTTVRTTGDRFYSIVRLADAPGVVRLARTDTPAPAIPEPEAGFVLVTYRAVHRPAKDLADAAGRVLSKPGGSAQVLGDGGLILIADLAPRVEQSIGLLRLVDVPLEPAIVREVRAQHVNAATLAATVGQVAARTEAVSGRKVPGEVVAAPSGLSVILICPPGAESYWSGLISDLDKREPVATLSYSCRHFAVDQVGELIERSTKDPPGQAADDRWRLIADELTGTIIVTATPSQHASIRALMDRLDASGEVTPKPMRSFVLRNRGVEEVQAVLDRLIASGALAGADEIDGTSGTGIALPGGPGSDDREPFDSPAAAPEHTALTGQNPPPITFTSDKGTNTLIAMGEPRLLAQIEDLLRTLDVRQPQVMLEVLILSLSDSQTLDLGVEIEQLQVSGDVLIRLASLFGLSFRGPGGDRIVGDGQGFTGVVLSPGDFSVVLRALQTVNNGRSLSMPKVLVANNQVGTIDSVLEVPFASTNASSTVATTSLGGVRPAGTQVTIKPQIASGDHPNLDYSVSLSAFVGAAADPQLPPPRQQNSINSTATIPDGYTVAVGGIELTSDAKATSQIPFFGQIPIVGEAFKRRSKNTSRQRFYVFIRANVYRQNGFEDLKYISDRETMAAGVDDGWPVLEPRVIR